MDLRANHPERFFALALDLMAVVDPDGVIVRVNAAWEDVLGYDPCDLLGRPFLEFVHPDDVARTVDATARLNAGEPLPPFENRYRRRGGGWVDVQWLAHRPAGDPHTYGVGRDVTVQRRHEHNERALNRAWMAVASPAQLDDILQVIVDEARALIGAEQAVISLEDVATAAHTVSAVSLGERYAAWRDYREPPRNEGIYRLPVSTTLSMRLTQEQLEAHPAWRGFGADRSRHPPMRGWLAVPLVAANERGLGLLQLSDKSDGGDFDAEDERLVRELARIAALTVERAQAQDRAATERARAARLLESIRDAFFSVDHDWCFTYVNDAAGHLLDRDPDELVGRHIWTEFPEAETGPIGECYRRAVSSGEAVSFVEHYAPLGRWFDVRAYPAPDGLSVYFLDATERIEATQDLAVRANQQLAVAEVGQAALGGQSLGALLDLALAHIGRAVAARTATIMEVQEGTPFVRRRSRWPQERDDAAEELPLVAGTSFAEALRTGRLEVVEDYAQAAPEAAELARRLGVGGGVSLPLGRPDAPWAVLAVGFSHPGRPPERDLLFLQQIGHVLTTALERQRSEERVRHQATHDALTGLPNRERLREQLEAAAEQAIVQGGCAGLLLLDLDGFKDVNDSLGHGTGDLVLEQVAERLKEVVDPRHLVGRLGGDEFGVCVRRAEGADEVGAIAEAVRAALVRPFRVAELEIALSASIGIALAPDHGLDASTLMRHADVAMYRAKLAGDAVARYDAAVDAARTERLTLVADLRVGIAREHFAVEYQPIVELATGRPVALEALVRWHSPTRGVVQPGGFIPLAEQSGLIGPLTELVVDQVAAASARLGHGLRTAVNFSVAALLDADVSGRLVERLILARDIMTVEITESSLANRRALAVLDRLAAGGVSCAIDDFGTGWSSMASLKSLPVRQLKVDRAFVAGLATDDGSDAAIVRSVVGLGHALGLDVIAEGVETQVTADRLREAGVHLAQGFVFARPMPAAALRRWLDDATAGTRP